MFEKGLLVTTQAIPTTTLPRVPLKEIALVVTGVRRRPQRQRHRRPAGRDRVLHREHRRDRRAPRPVRSQPSSHYHLPSRNDDPQRSERSEEICRFLLARLTPELLQAERPNQRSRIYRSDMLFLGQNDLCMSMGLYEKCAPLCASPTKETTCRSTRQCWSSLQCRDSPRRIGLPRSR